MRKWALFAGAALLAMLGFVAGRLGFVPFSPPASSETVEMQDDYNAAPSKVTGALPVPRLNETLRSHLAEARACWGPGPQQNAMVRLHFEIASSGTITEAKVIEPCPYPDVANCILAASKSWSFPADDSPTSVDTQWTVLHHPKPSRVNPFL